MSGRYPVFTAHTKELEQMLCFTAGLEQRLRDKGKDSGEQFDCLLRVRRKCKDLLLEMYAEDSGIILMNSCDREWVRKIVGYVHDVILAENRIAG